VTSSLFPASHVIRLYTGNVLAAVNTFSASVGTGTNDADLEGNVTALGALLGVENEQSVQVAGALPHAVTPENPAAAGTRPDNVCRLLTCRTGRFSAWLSHRSIPSSS
jgi:hypothetical protein